MQMLCFRIAPAPGRWVGSWPGMGAPEPRLHEHATRPRLSPECSRSVPGVCGARVGGRDGSRAPLPLILLLLSRYTESATCERVGCACVRSRGPLRVARPSVKPAPATGSVLVAPGDLRGVGVQRLGRQMAGETCAAKQRGAAGVCAVAGLGSERSIQVGSPKGWWAQGRALRTRWYRQLAVRCSGWARIVIVSDLGQERCAQTWSSECAKHSAPYDSFRVPNSAGPSQEVYGRPTEQEPPENMVARFVGGQAWHSLLFRKSKKIHESWASCPGKPKFVQTISTRTQPSKSIVEWT